MIYLNKKIIYCICSEIIIHEMKWTAEISMCACEHCWFSLRTISKNVGSPRVKCLRLGFLDHIRPIQRFLEIRPGPLTFLERSSRVLRCSGCIHTDVTSSVPLSAPRTPSFLDLSARTSFLLCLLTALPFHSAILKPDLYLQ